MEKAAEGPESGSREHRQSPARGRAPAPASPETARAFEGAGLGERARAAAGAAAATRELPRPGARGGGLPQAGRKGAEGKHDRAQVRRDRPRLRPLARCFWVRSGRTGATSPTRPRPTTSWPWPSRSAPTSAGRPQEAETDGKRIATLSLKSQFRFDSPGQRTDFANAVRTAVVDVIARHSSPNRLESGRPGKGKPFRLVLACYPASRTEADEAAR